MSFTVKDHKVLMNLMLYRYHRKLVALVTWCYVRLSEVTITSAWREGDEGVHGCGRGIDIRSRCFDVPQAIADEINKHWKYDPARPEKMCALYHDSGQGPHIHLQVSDATILQPSQNVT